MSKKDEYISIKITRIILTIAGFWDGENKKEKIILKFCKIYSLQAIIGAIITQAMEVTISLGSLSDITYWLCAGLPLSLVIIKFSLYFYKRHKLIALIRYTKKHIWFKIYNKYDREIMDASNKEAMYSIGAFIITLYFTIMLYTFVPIIENIGQSEEDRKFPFNGISKFLDSDAKKSPKFEITYVIQVLPLLHTGILVCCFDNLFYLLSSFLVGQFKILQRRLKIICDSLNLNSEKNSQELRDKLKELIEYHKSLTIYISKMEDIFSFHLFFLIFVATVMICVTGIQVFLIETSYIKGMLFKFHLSCSLLQTYITTYNGNNIITESNQVAYSAYEMLWYCIPFDKHGKSIRQAVGTIIMRSQRSCYISAGGFFPVSLASFMSVMSTTVSYFTLLRQFL